MKRRRPYRLAKLAGYTLLGVAASASVVILVDLLEAGPSAVPLKTAGVLLGTIIIGAALKAWSENR